MSNKSIRWDDDMIALLRLRRSEGVPIYLCAEQVGVSYTPAVLKCRELGIAGRFNRGRTPGETVIRCSGSKSS
jgi:hypothetical protein